MKEIDLFIKQDTQINAVIHFVKLLPTPSPDWIIWTALLGLIVGIIFGFSTVPFLQSWLWGPLFVLAAFVAVIVFYLKVTAQRVRKWVNRVLIPKADAAHIDLSVFVSLIAGVDTKVEGLDQRITDMATNLETIADELSLRGRLKLGEEADSIKQDASLPQESLTAS